MENTNTPTDPTEQTPILVDNGEQTPIGSPQPEPLVQPDPFSSTPSDPFDQEPSVATITPSPIEIAAATVLYDLDPQAKQIIDSDPRYSNYTSPETRSINGAKEYYIGRIVAEHISPDGSALPLLRAHIDATENPVEKEKLTRQLAQIGTESQALQMLGTLYSQNILKTYNDQQERAKQRAAIAQAQEKQRAEALKSLHDKLNGESKTDTLSAEELSLATEQGYDPADIQLAATCIRKIAGRINTLNEVELRRVGQLLGNNQTARDLVLNYISSTGYKDRQNALSGATRGITAGLINLYNTLSATRVLFSEATLPDHSEPTEAEIDGHTPENAATFSALARRSYAAGEQQYEREHNINAGAKAKNATQTLIESSPYMLGKWGLPLIALDTAKNYLHSQDNRLLEAEEYNRRAALEQWLILENGADPDSINENPQTGETEYTINGTRHTLSAEESRSISSSAIGTISAQQYHDAHILAASGSLINAGIMLGIGRAHSAASGLLARNFPRSARQLNTSYLGASAGAYLGTLGTLGLGLPLATGGTEALIESAINNPAYTESRNNLRQLLSHDLGTADYWLQQMLTAGLFHGIQQASGSIRARQLDAQRAQSTIDLAKKIMPGENAARVEQQSTGRATLEQFNRELERITRDPAQSRATAEKLQREKQNLITEQEAQIWASEEIGRDILVSLGAERDSIRHDKENKTWSWSHKTRDPKTGEEKISEQRYTEDQTADLFLIRLSNLNEQQLQHTQESIRAIRDTQDTIQANALIEADRRAGGTLLDLRQSGAPEILIPLHASNGTINQPVRRGIAQYITRLSENASALINRAVALSIERNTRAEARAQNISHGAPSDVDTPSMVIPRNDGKHIMLYVSGRGNMRAHLNDIIQRDLRDSINATAAESGRPSEDITRELWESLSQMQNNIARQSGLPADWLLGREKEYSERGTIEALSRLAISKTIADRDALKLTPTEQNYIDYVITALESMRASVALALHIRDWQASPEGQQYLSQPGNTLIRQLETIGLRTGALLAETSRLRISETEKLYRETNADIPSPTRPTLNKLCANDPSAPLRENDTITIPASENISESELRIPAEHSNPGAPESLSENPGATLTVEKIEKRLHRTFSELLAYRQTNDIIRQLSTYARNTRAALQKSNRDSNTTIAETIAITNGLIATFKNNPLLAQHLPAERAKNGRESILTSLIRIQQHFAQMWQSAEKGEAQGNRKLSEEEKDTILQHIRNIERESIRAELEPEIERQYIKEHYIDLARRAERDSLPIISELVTIAGQRSNTEQQQLRDIIKLVGIQESEKISTIARIISTIKTKHHTNEEKKTIAEQYRNILKSHNKEIQRAIRKYIRDTYKNNTNDRQTRREISKNIKDKIQTYLKQANKIINKHKQTLQKPEQNPDKQIGAQLLEIAKAQKLEQNQLIRHLINAFGVQRRDPETIANARAALELLRELSREKSSALRAISDYTLTGKLSRAERESETYQNYLNEKLDQKLNLQKTQLYKANGNLRNIALIRSAIIDNSINNLRAATDSILNLFAGNMREAIKQQLKSKADQELSRYQQHTTNGRASKPLISESAREELELYRDLLDISGEEKNRHLEQLRSILDTADTPESISIEQLTAALNTIRQRETQRAANGRYNRDILRQIDQQLRALEQHKQNPDTPESLAAKRDAIDYISNDAAIVNALGNYRGMSLSSAEAAISHILRTARHSRQQQRDATAATRNAIAAENARLATEYSALHGNIDQAALSETRQRYQNSTLLQIGDTLTALKSFAQTIESLKGSGRGRGKGEIYSFWSRKLIDFSKRHNEYIAQEQEMHRARKTFLYGSGIDQLNLSHKDARKFCIQLKQSSPDLRYTLHSQQQTTITIPRELARELLEKGNTPEAWETIIRRAQQQNIISEQKAPHYEEREELKKALADQRNQGREQIDLRVSGRQSKTIELTYDQALNLLLLHESGQYARNFEHWGYTTEILAHMRSVLQRDFDIRYKRRDGQAQHDIVYKYGDWMRRQLDNPARHAIYEELNGRPMGLVENYWSGHFLEVGKEKELAEYDQGRSPKTIRYRDTIVRRNHLAEPNHELGAEQVFAIEYALQNRYIHFAAYCSEMRQRLADKNFSGYLESELGYANYRRFKDSLDAIDGVTPIEIGLYSGINKLLKKFLSVKAVDALAFRITTLMKQGSGFLNASAWETVTFKDICTQLLLDMAGQGRASYRDIARTRAFSARIKENDYIDRTLTLQGKNPSISLLYHAISKASGRAIEYSDLLMNLIGSKHLYNLMWRKLAEAKRAELKEKGNERDLTEEEKSELDRTCEDIITAQLELSAQPLDPMSKSMQALTNPNLLIANMNFMGGEVINKLGMSEAIWGRERNENAINGSTGERLLSIGKRIALTYGFYAEYNIIDQLIMIAIDALKGTMPTDDEDKIKSYIIGNALMALTGGTMINYNPIAGKAISGIIEKTLGRRTFVGDAFSELSTLNQIWGSIARINKALDTLESDKDPRNAYLSLIEAAIGLTNGASVMSAFGLMGSSSIIGNAMSGALLTASAAGNLVIPFIKGLKNDALWTRDLPEPISLPDRERERKKKAAAKRKAAKARAEARDAARRARREQTKKLQKSQEKD